MPPSTSNTAPAMYEASGDEMNTMAFAISSGVARRPNGAVEAAESRDGFVDQGADVVFLLNVGANKLSLRAQRL
jgi:hypothetical protein